MAGSSYNENMGARYPNQSHIMSSSSRMQYENTQFAPNDQQQLMNNSQQMQNARYDNNVGLALGPPQSSCFPTVGSSVQQTNLNSFEDWSNTRDKGVEEYLSEEEIRLRSHEMLENEDMQHLLRLFSMGGHAAVNIPEDGFGFTPFMAPSPSFGYDEDRPRPGKAVVGWLKIKAAMRWGFFIRKKAAERRAQLVELDDE